MPSPLPQHRLISPRQANLGGKEIFDSAQAPCVDICRTDQLLASTFARTLDSVRHNFGPLRQDLPASASTFAEPTISARSMAFRWALSCA
jgi:hypothetical protein